MHVNKLRVVAATDAHLVQVVTNLRKQDQAELLACGVLNPLDQFRWGHKHGQCWAVIAPSGRACAVGGVIPAPGENSAAVWLMGTDELTLYWREFLRRSTDYIEELHRIRPILFNLVHVENEIHRRWLKWAGFSLLPQPVFVGKGRAVFQKFIRIR